MAHAAFDTLKFAEKLKATGVPEKRAIALSEAQNEAMIEALDSNLATKRDISQIEAAIKVDVSKAEATLKLNIAHIEAEIKLLKWMTGFLLAGTATLIIKAFF